MPGAWTLPSTWTGGQLVGATDLNQQVRDNILWLGGTSGIITNAASASALAGATTTSTTFVNIPSMTITTTTTGGEILAILSGSFQNSSSTTNDFGLAVDGVNQGPVCRFQSNAINVDYAITAHWAMVPSAASHIFTWQWKTTTGTLAADSASYLYMSIIEWRR